MRMCKCDRCGQIFEPADRQPDTVQTMISQDEMYHYRSSQTYDLCPECMEKLVDFLKGGELHEERKNGR